MSYLVINVEDVFRTTGKNGTCTIQDCNERFTKGEHYKVVTSDTGSKFQICDVHHCKQFTQIIVKAEV